MRKLVDLVSKVGQKSFILSELMMFVGATGLLVLAPFFLSRVVLQWSQSALPVVPHIIVLLVFFAILGSWAWVISGDRGVKLFRSLYKKGITWPFLFSIALLLFAIPCFASLTSTLNDHHLIKFDPAIPPQDYSQVQDFYAWNFLESIPSLNVPETLGWDKPYKDGDALARILLLAFKLTVIIPVVGSFTVWNRIRKEAKEVLGTPAP